MKAIIYVSQAQIEFDEAALRELASEVARINKTQDVTGYLWFKKGQFLQYIEGDAEILDALMLRIGGDSRHQVVHTIERVERTKRLFPEWSMRYFSKDLAYEIGLETILTDQLFLMNTAYKKHAGFSEMPWRIVEKIAKQSCL